MNETREDEFVNHLRMTKPRSRVLRPLAAAALAATMGISVASTAIAQESGTPAARIDVAGAPVALHAGSCTDPVLEPAFEIGALELEARYANEYGLSDDFAEIGTGDIDADGVLDADEEGYLSEDVDDDGVLDDGEDLNDNGLLDVGFDEDGDGVLNEAEIIPATSGSFTTVWKADDEVDATFEELFSEEEEDDDTLGVPGVVALHASSEDYGNILACAELNAPAGWEDRDTVVLGITPTGSSDLYGYAVFERDTGNIPVFGENTTGVTVYVIDNLPTIRDFHTMEGTPES